jgi:hypothetical protein
VPGAISRSGHWEYKIDPIKEYIQGCRLAGLLSGMTAWIGVLFLVFSFVIFLLSIKDRIKGNVIASTTRLKVAFIFTLVGLGLIFLQAVM